MDHPVLSVMFKGIFVDIRKKLVTGHPSLPGPHVPRDLGALRRGVVAQRALVRLLTRVRPPVHHQIGLLREVLAAELACSVVVDGRSRSRSFRHSRRPWV